MKPISIFTAVLSVSVPATASAFCGFYVSGAGADMFNNATQVVLMREGTRTVLSMQNNYQGPPKDFAMVVPVPVVLQEENVKTLDKGIFKRVDQLAAPRLVEYWEQDPCMQLEKPVDYSAVPSADMPMETGAVRSKELGVTIEAQFTVGEYQIVILSAKDSTGLDTWLRQEKYQIPEGAEPLLRPYVEAGSKFFVAKVDVEKVTFKDGMAELSPLRFHYDSEEFSLPVRLGMINSAGTQDLIVHILARGKRYEVSNYRNVTIPTNLDVADQTRERFGEFYAALFDATLEKNPGAVVTEYSWDAGTCDPCPTPALNPGELATLGEDVLYAPRGKRKAKTRGSRSRGGFVLTRLHARYGKGDLADDLVFKEAGAITGGRELGDTLVKLKPGQSFLDDDFELEDVQPAEMNTFQARYAIRHKWQGPIECENPRRGIWGGRRHGSGGSSAPIPALDLAFAPRGKVSLASFVKGNVPGLDMNAAGAEPAPKQPEAEKPAQKSEPEQPAPKKDSKGCAASGAGVPGAGFWLLMMAIFAMMRRRAL